MHWRVGTFAPVGSAVHSVILIGTIIWWREPVGFLTAILEA
jgi:hypothetical protein